MKYRRKAPLYDAMQFCPSDGNAFPAWFNKVVKAGKVILHECHCGACRDRGKFEINKCTVMIDTDMCKDGIEGDYIVLFEDGTLRVLDDKTFHDRYEEAGADGLILSHLHGEGTVASTTCSGGEDAEQR